MKKNLTSIDYWIRALYVLLFLFCNRLASMLMGLIALLQILFTLITGQANFRLRQFGQALAQYIYSVNVFVTCQSEIKPFPFADWPQAEMGSFDIAQDAEVISSTVTADPAEEDTENKDEIKK